MSRSDWTNGIAVTVIVALVVLPSAALNWWPLNYAPKKEQASYAEQQCALYKAQHSRMSWPIVFDKVVKPTPEQQRSDQSHNKQEDDANWCDLAAQESMAQSTAWMKWAAWAGIVLSFVGIGLLAATLHYTKEAAKAAKSGAIAGHCAASAAHQGTQVVRMTSARQLRAYISFVEANCINMLSLAMLEKEDRRVAQLVFKNSGQTPADKIRVIHGTILTDKSEAELFSNNSVYEQVSPPKDFGPLGPGHDFHMRVYLDDPEISNCKIEQIKNGKAFLFVFGQVQYEDVFGEACITSYRLVFNADSILDPQGQMSVCESGNWFE